jgi:hypothetical protein
MHKLRLLTTTCLLLGCVATLTPVAARAQSPFDGNSSDNRNPFGRASAGDTSGLMQLINEAQIRGKFKPRTAEEQEAQIGSATEDFRQRQLRLLRQKLKSNPGAENSTQP